MICNNIHYFSLLCTQALSLFKPPLKVGHRWVIVYHPFIMISLPWSEVCFSKSLFIKKAPDQIGRHLSDNISNSLFLNENVWTLIEVLLDCVLWGLIDGDRQKVIALNNDEQGIVIKEFNVFLNEWWINLLESTWMYISKTGVLGLTGSGGTPGVYPIYGTYLSEMWVRPMHVRGINLTWMIWHADLLIWVCMRGSVQMWEKAERG